MRADILELIRTAPQPRVFEMAVCLAVYDRQHYGIAVDRLRQIADAERPSSWSDAVASIARDIELAAKAAAACTWRTYHAVDR